MRLTILDKLDFAPDQLARMREFGGVTVYNDFPDTKTAIKRLEHTDIAIVGWTTLDNEALEQLAHVKYIALAQTGYEFVDVAAANKLGIPVSNAPGYSRQSVAEYAFALMLAAMRHIPEADRQVRGGNVLSPTAAMLGSELYGKTLGILGLGSIGSWIGRIGNGFGMEVIGYSRAPKNLPNIKDVSLDELLAQSDVLAVAVDINASTANILNANRLQTIKQGATLVNITSNQVLDEDALAKLLKSGHIKGAGFDDLSHSGYDDKAKGKKSPLIDLPNVVLSPQAGWYTAEAEQRLLDMVIENVEGFMSGKPKHLVGSLFEHRPL